MYSQSCAQVSYGSGAGCNQPCTPFVYENQYGKLIIPLKFHKSALNIGVNVSQVSQLVDAANAVFESNAMKIKFSFDGFIENHATLNSNFCISNDNNAANCDCSLFGGESYPEIASISNQNSSSINIFVFENIFGNDPNATSPCEANDYLSVPGISFPQEDPSDDPSSMVLSNTAFLNNLGNVLAHELGHIFALSHTFTTGEFDENECSGNDGIYDTPPDENGLDGTSTCNLMDYNSPSSCPNHWTLTTCQKAKIYNTLYTCRNNLCSNPTQPDVQLASGLSVINLVYPSNAGLDKLFPKLNQINGTNTGNYAQFKLRNTSGIVLNTWYLNEFDLSDVFGGVFGFPKEGTYFLDVRDSSVYSTCISPATTLQISFESVSGSGNCFDIVYADFSYQCGPATLNETTARKFKYGGRTCSAPPNVVTGNPISNNGNNGNNNGPGDPGEPGNGNNGTVISGVNIPPVTTKNEDCRECLDLLLKKLNKAILNNQNGGN